MKQPPVFLLGCCMMACHPLMAQEANRQNQPRRQANRFERFFTLPMIEFSKEQQTKVVAIEKDFLPKLTENQKKWDDVITPEQNQVRRDAFQKAIQDGKRGRERQEGAIDAAITFTDEQKK